MFNQQQPQMALPFSPMQPQFPYGNYNAVPSIGLEPHIQQFVQLLQPISSILIEEIQTKAPTSPLRMFMFNQMANNGFQNAEFTSLVKGAIEYFAYLIRRGQPASQQLVVSAAQKMAMFIAAANYRNFPALRQYEDPNKIGMVLNEFDAISQDVGRERAQGAYPGVQSQWSSNPGGGFNQFNTQQPMNQFSQPNFQQAAGPTATRSYGNSSGIFVNSNSDQQSTTDMGSPGMGRNFNSAQVNTQATEPVSNIQQEIVNSLEQSETVVDLAEANRRWKPTEQSYYRPAFEPSHQKLVAVKKNDRYFYQVKELGESEMDPSRHRVSSLFGTTNSIIAEKMKGQTQDTSRVLAEAVSDAKTAAPSTDCTLDTYTRIYIEDMATELGYDSVWVSGIVERIRRMRARGDDTPINITQWNSSVVKPVVIEKPEIISLIRKMSMMDSSQLITTIKQNKNMLSSSLIATLDERLTEVVNNVIKTNMSISGLSIESFIDDWNDLVNIISNKYGEMIAAKFVSRDEEMIRTALNILDEKIAHDITMDVYNTEDSETYPISYFTEHVSFTMLEFFSSELDIDFIDGTSALLSKVNTRVWYDLAEQIFREYGDKCSRHLIRTCDDKILEIKKGWLTDNAYIIHKVS